MLYKVFVFGRPGSGKSIAVRVMEGIVRQKGWNVVCLKDYDILYKMFLEDVEHKKFQPVEAGFDGFDVTDFSVLEEALEQLKQQIIEYHQSAATKLLFVELARDNYDAVLDHLSRDNHLILRNARILLIESEVELCIQRIYERAKGNVPDDYRLLLDDKHFVSENILRTYYSQQDLSKSHDTINNNGTREEFFEQIHRYIEILLAEESKIGL